MRIHGTSKKDMKMYDAPLHRGWHKGIAIWEHPCGMKQFPNEKIQIQASLARFNKEETLEIMMTGEAIDALK